MPDPQKIRTWTDRSGSFKVEAEFLGLKEGKIHLHKLNGVKIAVPVVKMSVEDLEYVEWATGVSLDEDKPLSDIKRSRTRSKEQRQKDSASRPSVGASVEPKKPEYDWFDFFLQAGVDPQICQRYATAFSRDNMSEENMVDITPQLLRTLGLKEGDILRVMKMLDKKFSRQRNVSFGDATTIPDGQSPSGEGSAANGSLFSGPGGTLRNNTRRGRPSPAQVTKDEVDPKAFGPKTDGEKKTAPADGAATLLTSAPASKKDLITGFDDSAWEPRESKTQPAPTPASSAPVQAAATTAPATAPAPVQAAPTGAAAELSLLSAPLQPTPAPQPAPQPPAQQQAPSQPSGATPSLFEQLAKAPTYQPPQQQQVTVPQITGFVQPPQLNVPRQRPIAPQQTGAGSVIAPPQQRAASAPHANQQSGFGPPPPLQPQLTGFPQQNQLHVQPGPLGQSMNEIQRQQQFQQQQQNFQQSLQPTSFQPGVGFNPQQVNGLVPQPTGFPQFPPHPNPTGFPGFQQPQPTGFQPSFQQALINGQQAGSPFADPSIRPFQPQPTGFPNTLSQPPLQPQPTGINAFLPPPLIPQPTGALPPTQFQSTLSPPPVPPIPQSQQPLQPLVPQKTGPPPPVRFGVNNTKKLTPQPTGRRANLAQASEFKNSYPR